jgi:ATP-dependent exoDNAse (exonuclease V) beta subunit
MMGERKDAMKRELVGEPEAQAELVAPPPEEPLVLPPKEKRKQKTAAELRESLRPAHAAWQALEHETGKLEKRLQEAKEKERKIRNVRESAVKQAGLIDASRWGFGRFLRRKESVAAHENVAKLSETLAVYEEARKEAEAEYAKHSPLAEQGSKLLSAMQPEGRELKKLERCVSFDQSLRETVQYLQSQRPETLERKRGEMVKMLKSTFPEFTDEIERALPLNS